MTFAELLSSAYEDLDFASSPATAVTTRLKKYINDGVRAVVGEPGMARILDSDAPLTVASVASQARYVIGEAVAEIRHISERTNDLGLGVMDLATYRAIDPDATSTTGIPTHYVPIGRVAVAVQPSDASSIFVKSDSASDTTQTLTIEGIITGGYMRTVTSSALTGLTAINVSSAVSTFIEITDAYLSAAGAGTITIHEDSGSGTELARITIGATRPRYLGFYLWPTPSSAITYYVDYRRNLVDMANNTDEPPGPQAFHPVYAAYARAREYEKTNDDRFPIAQAEYEKWLKKMKFSVFGDADSIPVIRWSPAMTSRRSSRLGGLFPADTW